MQQSGTAMFDNPEAYIAGDRRRALAAGTTMPDRVHGAALFADISGFTALTEGLVADLGPRRGAEDLAVVLGTVFDTVLGELHRHGGTVVYFSGDAVTCWFDGDDGLLAARCALAMQRAMDRVGLVPLPSGGHAQLRLKIAIAVGPARRFVVGDPDIQLVDVLAGALMERLAEAEQAAVQGEVVLDRSAVDSLGDRVEIAERRVHEGNGTAYDVAVVRAVPTGPPLPAVPAYRNVGVFIPNAPQRVATSSDGRVLRAMGTSSQANEFYATAFTARRKGHVKVSMTAPDGTEYSMQVSVACRSRPNPAEGGPWLVFHRSSRAWLEQWTHDVRLNRRTHRRLTVVAVRGRLLHVTGLGPRG